MAKRHYQILFGLLALLLISIPYIPWVQGMTLASEDRIMSYFPHLGGSWLAVRSLLRPVAFIAGGICASIALAPVLLWSMKLPGIVRRKISGMKAPVRRRIKRDRIRTTLIKLVAFHSPFIFIIIPLVAELACRQILHLQPEKADFYISPAHFFLPDSGLGWRNGTGSYTVMDAYTHVKIFDFHTDKYGHRINSVGKADSPDIRPSIDLYGCSFTFGFSIPDTATQAYKLQTKLDKYRVVNKGVPGYGLSQMYQALQRSVQQGDTPRIAIFNYADFHDMRTPLCRQMSGTVHLAVSQGESERFDHASFPYYDIAKGELQPHSIPLHDMPRNWPGTDQSAFLLLLNRLYISPENKQFPHFHEISLRTAVDMMEYCRDRHIIPIWANMTIPEKNHIAYDIIDTLAARGYYTVDYGIDPSVRDYWAPLDPGHPSGLAHSIFAEKTYKLLSKNNLTGEQNMIANQEPRSW